MILHEITIYNPWKTKTLSDHVWFQGHVELAHVVQGHEIKQSMIATWDANFKKSITTYTYFFDKRGGGCSKRWK